MFQFAKTNDIDLRSQVTDNNEATVLNRIFFTDMPDEFIMFIIV